LKKEDPKEKKKVKFSVPDDKKDESVQKKSTQPVQSRKPPTKNSAHPKSLPEAPHSLSYYSYHLPSFIIEHIEKLLNPNSDGHCRFQAVSSILHQDQDQWPKIREDVANQISSKKEHYEDNLLFLNVERPSSASSFNFLKMKNTNPAAQKTEFPFQVPVMLLLIFIKGLFSFFLNLGLKPCSHLFHLQTTNLLSTLLY
jgi:hypothetical protein